MDIQALTALFMWLTIINGAMLILWSVLFMVVPDLVYRTQSKWFPISRDNFNIIMYSFLALFKTIVLAFNVVPYLALLIIG